MMSSRYALRPDMLLNAKRRPTVFQFFLLETNMPRKASLILLVCFAIPAVFADYCSVYEKCDDGRICCNNQCVFASTCQGYRCIFDSDCNNGGYLSCCDGFCQYDCFNPVPAIVGSLVGFAILVAVISLLVYFCCRRRRATQGSVITPPQQRIITTTTTSSYNPPQPPPYQQPPGVYQGPHQPPPYCQPPPGNYSGYGAMDPRQGGAQPPMGQNFAPPPYTAEPSKNNGPPYPV
ncbi:uncharacterized protein LOC5522107 [Nematostella vectensis]|uniref:uncharacterized protein LOC5522107 n=1 Tax=Nematostella vectensis TaxID=45351 RepID=UPI00138FD923|nr:uncharacterized protein LOC5522107 [Nematostella vectensis]